MTDRTAKYTTAFVIGFTAWACWHHNWRLVTWIALSSLIGFATIRWNRYTRLAVMAIALFVWATVLAPALYPN